LFGAKTAVNSAPNGPMDNQKVWAKEFPKNLHESHIKRNELVLKDH
jgi:hypothetical protein